MRYTGQFKDINNDQYSIEIITNGSSSVNSTLSLSDQPCTLEWTGEDENIYKPIKYSSASIEYISDTLHLDLYAAKPLQNTVKVYKNNSIIWQGFITPNVYDNELDFSNTRGKIEAIDALAVMEYLDYTTIDGGAKKVVKIYDIIKHCLSKSSLVFSYLYINSNVKVDNTQWNTVTFEVPNKSYLAICYISECNFFDEDDVPMKCDEVLEEICKYFNLTMYVEGQNVYLVDYDAIRNGVNTYYRYNLSTDAVSKLTLNNTYTIGNTTHLIDGSNISIGNVYNKVSVESDVYTFENMIPDMFDDVQQVGSLYYDWVDDKEGYMYYMFLNNPNYKSYYYTTDTYGRVNPTSINYNTIQTRMGATLVKHAFEQHGDPGIVGDVNWSDYLLLHLHQKGNATPNVKLFETNITDLDERILANYDNYLIIKGTATYYDIEGYTAKVEHSQKGDKYTNTKVVIPCSLCYGGSQWWNGSAWQNTECRFDLHFYNANEQEHYIGKDFDVRSNIIWYDGLKSSTGHKIPINGKQIANISFAMYSPHSPNTEYRLDNIFIKDFNITVETSKNAYRWEGGSIYDFTYADELRNDNTNDTNIIYENVIDEGYVEEMSSIKNKITTFAKQQPSNSCVAFSINDSKESLFYATTVSVESLGEKMLEEEYTVTRLVNQYSQPNLQLDVTLQGELPMHTLVSNTIVDSTKKFIINGKSTDLAMCQSTYNLIEKR